MLKPFLVVLALAVSALSLAGPTPAQNPLPSQSPSSPQSKPAAQPATVPGIDMVNPVKATEASQARARQIFGYDCAMCHGEKGNGKGDLAVTEALPMKDYSSPDTLKGLTDGELFVIIRDGKDKMPEEGDRAKTDEMWNLVIYLRSLAKKPAA